MAPSSEERREVAARLKACVPEINGTLDFAMFLNHWIGVGNVNVDGQFSVKSDRRTVEMTLEKLADLIEPQQIDEDTSDGYHTFRQLYYQRMMLFAVLVKEHKELAWKTRRHEDGKPCFGGGWFLVTIETPDGPYGYHYESKYWDLFDCEEIPKAKHWDGYDESDVGRLMSLVTKRGGAKNDTD
jgi:hypothetical protein